MMSPEQRKEIEERVAAATPGPWEAVPECPDSIAANVTRATVPGGQKLSATWIAVVDMENRHDYTDELESESAECDRSFIAHARTDIPALLSALDAAEARAKAAEARAKELEAALEFSYTLACRGVERIDEENKTAGPRLARVHRQRLTIMCNQIRKHKDKWLRAKETLDGN